MCVRLTTCSGSKTMIVCLQFLGENSQKIFRAHEKPCFHVTGNMPCTHTGSMLCNAYTAYTDRLHVCLCARHAL